MRSASAREAGAVAETEDEQAVALRDEGAERRAIKDREQVVQKHGRLAHGMDADFFEVVIFHLHAIAAAENRCAGERVEMRVHEQFAARAAWQARLREQGGRVQAGGVHEAVERDRVTARGDVPPDPAPAESARRAPLSGAPNTKNPPAQ